MNNLQFSKAFDNAWICMNIGCGRIGLHSIDGAAWIPWSRTRDAAEDLCAVLQILSRYVEKPWNLKPCWVSWETLLDNLQKLQAPDNLTVKDLEGASRQVCGIVEFTGVRSFDIGQGISLICSDPQTILLPPLPCTQTQQPST